MKRIVIFASGAGTNAENIIRYFSGVDKNVRVEAILTNNRKAGVLDKASQHRISAFYFNRTAFYTSGQVLQLLRALQPDLLVLAGFLWKVPDPVLRAFPGKTINIHPALLPKYGGKGMYGLHVHKAVVHYKEKETGMTIHYVNENYDEGTVIFQARTEVLATDTPETVAEKVQQLEYRHFPEIIEKLLNGTL